MKSLAHNTKGTTSPRTYLGLRLFVGVRFQVYFTPLVGVLFTFPSRYCVTIGRGGVLRLGGWSPRVQTELHVFRLTREHIIALPIRGYHPLRPCFPDRFWLSLMCYWPGPVSLATTTGVSVDVLSSRYLDVSVPWVCLKPPILFGSHIPSLDNRKSKTSRFGSGHLCSNTQDQGLGVPAIEGGFPHSEIRGSKLLRSSPRLIAA